MTTILLDTGPILDFVQHLGPNGLNALTSGATNTLNLPSGRGQPQYPTIEAPAAPTHTLRRRAPQPYGARHVIGGVPVQARPAVTRHTLRRQDIAQPILSPAELVPSQASKDSLRGVVFMVLGMFLFSAVDTHAKFLTESFHPIQVAWSRQLGLFLGVVVVLVVRGPGILKTDHRWLQMGRGALAAFSGTLFIVAVAFVPLADAVAISFVAPFIVTVLAALLLGEAVGVRRWVAVGIGFLATLIVIRPGLGVIHPAAALVLIAATCYALRQILSRKLSGTDPTITTIAYTALTSSALLTLPMPFVWRMPEWGTEILLLASMAILAGLAEIMVIRALELSQAVVLAPVHYSLLVWGTFYGWIVFDQLPDLWTWVGALIIIATGIYTLHRERLSRLRP
ncbi:MAG: DMT family transporter [Jannaschia sp.]